MALQVNTTASFTSQSLERLTDEEALSISQSTYPCIFKLGSEFFDFTPFKLVRNVWPALGGEYDPTHTVFIPDRTYNFTWCSPMSEASNATEYECNGDYYAVGSPLVPFACEPYSGDSPRSDIKASSI